MNTIKSLVFDTQLLTNVNIPYWGSLTIKAFDSLGKPIQLLYTEWHLDSLKIWLDETLPILSQPVHLPDKIHEAESLAHAYRRQLDIGQPDVHPVWYDQLYEVASHHSLRFACRGSNLPMIFLGIHHDLGEISCLSSQNQLGVHKGYVHEGDWAYHMSPIQFIESLQSLHQDLQYLCQ